MVHVELVCEVKGLIVEGHVFLDVLVNVNWVTVFDKNFAKFSLGHAVETLHELKDVEVLKFATDHFRGKKT